MQPRTTRTTRTAHRDATMAAIRTAARELLVSAGPDGVGLRAVARVLGLTAPALYRYVASHQELIDLVVNDVYDELIAALETAATQAADDAGARLEAASRAFRRWSLDHRAEFALVFANPIPGGESSTDAGKARLAGTFGRHFTALWEAQPFPVRTDLDPEVVRQLRAKAAAFAPGLPVGATYVFVRCWALLYGAVSVEVFGHLDWALDDAGPMFEQALRQIATEIAGRTA